MMLMMMMEKRILHHASCITMDLHSIEHVYSTPETGRRPAENEADRTA